MNDWFWNNINSTGTIPYDREQLVEVLNLYVEAIKEADDRGSVDSWLGNLIEFFKKVESPFDEFGGI